ncbi:hypothetical protein NIES37_46700 [Tolypothrix tenuis PCC 7101]|uniref:TonB C-terminal domain-containing protein n=1 Tax=Tolypothrix tenuis PCC 7101 TaxID=231146 RepID=A0A1Z4N4S6_9CYAN|nr:hypothetical protein [Aulosira sp. FACHB-113]BAZ00675.1 hypothetical protein NIES37_46700 [Tolypothrix tenuis PCC 7101]BAZ75402.1 hypothetical protein NIES50_39850 [Aulosira laxa NIES-50]
MSYVSLLKNLPEILGQPTGIAAIASVGIHGAIALIVPLVPVDSNKPKETASSKTVGVMELSQADQSRLPQIPGQTPINPQSPVLLSQSPVTPLNLDSQSSLPPLPPPPSPSQFVMPPIPSSAGNYSIAALPKRQPLRNYSQSNFRFDTSGFNGNNKFASVPRFNNRDITLGEAKPLPVSRLPVLPEGRLPDGLPNSPAPLPVDANPTPIADVAANPQPSSNPSQSGDNQQLIAAIGNTPKAGDNLQISEQGIPQGQLGSTPNLSNQAPTPGTELAIAQIKSYESLRAAVQKQYPNAVEKTVIRDTVTTDKADVQGIILGRLVVDPDGKVLDIQFEGQSVTPALRVEAMEYFKTNPPKGDRQIAHYPFSLEFKNNSNTAAGDNQKPATGSAATVKPLNLPLVNNSQPTPATGTTVQPLNLPAVNNNQPTSAPGSATTVKPLNLPDVNSNQLKPIPVTNTKPLTLPRVNNNQQTPAPATNVKPSSNSLINKLQSAPGATVKPLAAPVPTPATNIKPLAAPVPTPAATTQPLAAPATNNNQPTATVESGKKLVQQLRELRQERETSDQGK